MIENRVELSGKRILCVDDDDDIRHQIVKMFKTLGAEVDVAVDGMAGYELAKRNHYELIVTDILMPNLAGDRMVSRLRDEGWDGKVIAISAFHDGVWEHDLLEHGAVTCLYKPFKLDDMIKTLNEIF